MFALLKTILVTALAAGCAWSLSACGQRGNLYLTPEQQAEAARLGTRPWGFAPAITPGTSSATQAVSPASSPLP